MPRPSRILAAALAASLALSIPAVRLLPTAADAAADPLGTHVVLSWNDLGMHCMNQWHADFEVLPPFNTLQAQVIQRGDAQHPPVVLATGVTIEYSIPGNTYSVGKTDFWTYAPALFGVTLPPDVGLTGKGLTGTFDPAGTLFEAKGIPVTPFTDAAPTVENAYQKALVIARDGNGAELARSTPVIPVSVEVNCVSSGCHSSVNAILNSHEREAGFDPNVRPILCAKCHASPALGTTGIREANYFSYRIHNVHRFLDNSMSGTALCYKCHPGPKVGCLRGAMSQQHGLVCQDCHGNMGTMASSISAGRVPWLNEPSCGTCHGPVYAEQPGKLFRFSTGHGGVACEACHGSTHADFPSREAADNANNVALQGHAGVLSDCTVCHGVTPATGGAHQGAATSVEDGLLRGTGALRAWPNPMRESATFAINATPGSDGRLLVYDAQGRIVRMIRATPAASRTTLAWDGLDHAGRRVPAGTYFARWQWGGGGGGPPPPPRRSARDSAPREQVDGERTEPVRAGPVRRARPGEPGLAMHRRGSSEPLAQRMRGRQRGHDALEHPGPREVQPVEVRELAVGGIRRARRLQPCGEVGRVGRGQEVPQPVPERVPRHRAPEQVRFGEQRREKVVRRRLVPHRRVAIAAEEPHRPLDDARGQLDLPRLARPVVEEPQRERTLRVFSRAHGHRQAIEPADEPAGRELLERLHQLSPVLGGGIGPAPEFGHQLQQPRQPIRPLPAFAPGRAEERELALDARWREAHRQCGPCPHGPRRVGKAPRRAGERPVTVDARMPVERTPESRRQRAWQRQLAVVLEDQAQVVGVFTLDGGQRHLHERAEIGGLEGLRIRAVGIHECTLSCGPGGRPRASNALPDPVQVRWDRVPITRCPDGRPPTPQRIRGDHG